jgi:molecular chaperone DnaK
VALRRGRDGFAVASSKIDLSISAASLDERMVQLVLDDLARHGSEELARDPEIQRRLLHAAEAARKDIQTKRDQTVELGVSMPEAGGASGVMVERSFKLPRSRVYQAVEPVVDKVIEVVRAVLGDAGISPRALGAIVLGGAGGAFPSLVQALTALAGKEPAHAHPPSDVIARGLARFDARPAPKRGERPSSLGAGIGIGLPGGRFRPLIPAGAKLPSKLSRKHATARDDQTELELAVYQGGAEFVKGCVHLGTIALDGIPRAARGDVQVDVDIEVDADAVVSITLSEETSGRKKRLRVASEQTPPERREQLKRAVVEDLSDPTKAKQKKGLLGRLFKR